jgi:hypothetical protein
MDANHQGSLEGTLAALAQAIKEHLQWMASHGYAQSTQDNYRSRLTQFLGFIKSGAYSWEEIFTLTTLKRFKGPAHAVTSLSRYLYE